MSPSPVSPRNPHILSRFGPILAKFDFKNVDYSLRAFPLGGFVGFPDNDPDSETYLKRLDGKSSIRSCGRVAIIAVGAEVARSNIDGLYQFAALLNINLAVINLLPLPALDGRTLALIVLEAVREGGSFL
ncbi:hypothetical protein Bca101_081115 [Brassica carinata]